MTEFELSQYKAIQNEIDDLTFRIGEMEESGPKRHSTTVKGSLSVFPYIERHYTVITEDKDMIKQLKHKRERKRLELLKKEHEIHDYIYSIPDSLIRQIFTMTFIDGKTQEEIGRKLHLDRSTVSKKISKYIENKESGADTIITKKGRT